MTVIISDTSPLNYLVLIGETHVIPALYGRVIIPRAVLNELQDPETPEKVRTWIDALARLGRRNERRECARPFALGAR